MEITLVMGTLTGSLFIGNDSALGLVSLARSIDNSRHSPDH
jgi:hypothetical protein